MITLKKKLMTRSYIPILLLKNRVKNYIIEIVLTFKRLLCSHIYCYFYK